MSVVYVPIAPAGVILLQSGVTPPPSRVLAITLSVPRAHLAATFASPTAHLAAAFASLKAHITATLTEVAMTTPNTTIDSSATVTDQNGNLISNLAAYTLTVSFPDGSSASPTVVNEGAGVYTATYTTKGAGLTTEVWSFTDTSGAVAQARRVLPIAY